LGLRRRRVRKRRRLRPRLRPPDHPLPRGAPTRIRPAMQDELSGTVALITGCGNPTGIGMACARTLVREGADVAITSTTDRIHDRVQELGADRATGFVADLTERDQVRAL